MPEKRSRHRDSGFEAMMDGIFQICRKYEIGEQRGDAKEPSNSLEEVSAA